MPEEVVALGGSAILANAYHLFLRPGHECVRRMGGLHKFMNWPGMIITDSGGYQVFSMADLKRMDEDGVEFQSHIDGSRHVLTPEKCVEIQAALGSDVIMVLDDCPPYPCPREDLIEAVRRTTRWAGRCKSARKADQAMFAIVQGGVDSMLRKESAESLVGIGFDGYALGGFSVGEPKSAMWDTLDAVLPYLPPEAPRYLMGVGTPDDLLEGIDRGIDVFDCIIPTRHARTGILYTSRGPLKIMQSQYREDPNPLDESCSCTTCRNYSRSYLRHLHAAKEINAARLGTIHNLHFYFSLMRGAREAIATDMWSAFKKSFLDQYERGMPRTCSLM